MRLTELMIEYERRRVEAQRQNSSAPLEAVYRVVLEELRSLDGTETPDRMLDTEETARVLGVARKTAAKWAGDGRFLGAKKTSERGEWRIPARQVYGMAGGPKEGHATIPRLWTEDCDV